MGSKIHTFLLALELRTFTSTNCEYTANNTRQTEPHAAHILRQSESLNCKWNCVRRHAAAACEVASEVNCSELEK
jgi:hypothetical protein